MKSLIGYKNGLFSLGGFLLWSLLTGCASNYIWEGEKFGSIDGTLYSRKTPGIAFPIPELPDGEKCIIKTTESKDQSSGSINISFGDGQNQVGLHYTILAPAMATSLRQDNNFMSRQRQDLEQRQMNTGGLKTVDSREDFGLYLITPNNEARQYYYSFYSFFANNLLCNISLVHPSSLFSGNDTEIANYFYNRMLVFKGMIKFKSEAEK